MKVCITPFSSLCFSASILILAIIFGIVESIDVLDIAPAYILTIGLLQEGITEGISIYEKSLIPKSLAKISCFNTVPVISNTCSAILKINLEYSETIIGLKV